MKNLNEICIFKELEINNGSTFQDIRRLVEEENEQHELYKCIKCNGYAEDKCNNYRRRK